MEDWPGCPARPSPFAGRSQAEAAGWAGGLYVLASLELLVTGSVSSDSIDLFPGLFASSVDGLFASDGGDQVPFVAYQGVSVNLAPEPVGGAAELGTRQVRVLHPRAASGH